MADLDPTLDPAVRALAQRLRDFFRTNFPEIDERVYSGARSVGYRVEGLGTVCGLFIRGPRVHLVFPRGSEIPDPEGLLMGDGPGVRYATFRIAGPVHEDALFAIVVGALLVAGGEGGELDPPIP